MNRGEFLRLFLSDFASNTMTMGHGFELTELRIPYEQFATFVNEAKGIHLYRESMGYHSKRPN